MTDATVSVVVVSRNRPKSLALCLSALGQQLFEPFEIVVVADAYGCAAARSHPLGPSLKIIPFEAANVSAARNTGVAAAGGDIVAFIDDDAFAMPAWLSRLTMPFADARVSATGGFVCGRNGFSHQWKGRLIMPGGWHEDLAVAQYPFEIFEPPAEGAVRTEGANCAFRRSALIDIEGFDPRYRFFLDDADVNMRLARAGHRTALVPDAEVLHMMAPSAHRASDRMPRDLFEIGASTALFLKLHCPEAARADAFQHAREDQRHRLLRHMVGGTCTPEDVARLLHRFDAGAIEGDTRRAEPGLQRNAKSGFQPIAKGPERQPQTMLAGRPWNARELRQKAAQRVLDGHTVTLFLLSPTSLFHKLRYRPPGYWEQTGGIWGRSVRSGPLLQYNSFASRLHSEHRHLARRQGIAESSN